MRGERFTDWVENRALCSAQCSSDEVGHIIVCAVSRLVHYIGILCTVSAHRVCSHSEPLVVCRHFGKSYTWQEVHDVVEDHIARLDFETLLILLLMSLLAFILFLKQRRELPLQPPQRAH